MYAGNHWIQGNQDKICGYMRKKFDANYEGYWQCLSNSDNSNQIYGSTIYDYVGYIRFDLNDGLSVYIFKSPGKFLLGRDMQSCPISFWRFGVDKIVLLIFLQGKRFMS
jgi:hypothetical protein